MQEAKQGEWVQIHSVILPAGRRAPQIPAETQCVSLEMRVRGYLLDAQAGLGRIKTAAGRELAGVLVAVRPRYSVDYGDPQPELLMIGRSLRELLEVKADG